MFSFKLKKHFRFLCVRWEMYFLLYCYITFKRLNILKIWKTAVFFKDQHSFLHKVVFTNLQLNPLLTIKLKSISCIRHFASVFATFHETFSLKFQRLIRFALPFNLLAAQRNYLSRQHRPPRLGVRNSIIKRSYWKRDNTQKSLKFLPCLSEPLLKNKWSALQLGIS